jgi:hypothetical protein
MDLLETPPAEATPFAIALSFLAYVSPREAVEALQKRVLVLEGQIAALDAGMLTLADEFRMPRLALVEEEWNRTQRQAEYDFARHLIDGIRSGRITWDVDWDELNPSDASPPSPIGEVERPDRDNTAHRSPSRPKRPPHGA